MDAFVDLVRNTQALVEAHERAKKRIVELEAELDKAQKDADFWWIAWQEERGLIEVAVTPTRDRVDRVHNVQV